MNQMTATQAPAVTGPQSATPDFDTRLMLAGVGMDVRLSLHDGVQEAHQDAADATAAADRYSVARLPYEDTRTPVHRILARTADVIRERGWVQCAWTGEDGSVCMMMAVSIADTDGNVFIDAHEELARRTSPLGPTSWNDAPGRTREEVLALLEA